MYQLVHTIMSLYKIHYVMVVEMSVCVKVVNDVIKAEPSGPVNEVIDDILSTNS